VDCVQVGLIGAGFAADLHAEAWARVGAGVSASVVGVASARPERARAFAAARGIPTAYGSVDDLLAQDAVHVVDVCAPNSSHHPVALAALKAGKHVVVEKPFTGSFTAGLDWSERRRAASAQAQELVSAAEAAGRWLCYAENWIYAPSVQKAASLLRAAGGTILRIVGEESHSGTHSEANKRWETAGGGALFGKGCHPLAAALWLKRPVRAKSVVASVASLTKVLSFVGEEPKFLRTGYQDVEDWGAMLLTFEDGTVAQVTAGDTTLGGVRNQLTVFSSRAVVEANMNPSDAVRAYAPDSSIFASEYLVEKLETKAGWSTPAADEAWAQGYPQEMQDFAEAVARGRPPASDGSLGLDVVEVLYAAYESAAEGRRVELTT
jgi:predicted dehydrogenase